MVLNLVRSRPHPSGRRRCLRHPRRHPEDLRERTLAKLNAFDLVVTVALGSTRATIFLDTNDTWSQGAVALTSLALLQFLVAALTTRFGGRAVVTTTPTLLVQQGQILQHVLRAQRVTEAEIWQAVRSSGVGDIGMIAAAVLETDGTISIATQQQAGNRSALRDVPEASPHGGPDIHAGQCPTGQNSSPRGVGVGLTCR